MTRSRRAGACPLLLLLLWGAPAGGAWFFKITVIDKATRQPISGVRLRTTNQLAYTTDRNGVAAFYEPGLMGRRVFFTPEKPGYQHAADFLGIRGTALDVTEGGSGTIELSRAAGDPGPPLDTTYESRLAAGPVPGPAQRFRIQVVDQATGRGVPLIEVRSPRQGHFTDSAGLVAFHDLDLMGQRVRFTVHGHGYRFPDGAVELQVVPGGRATLRVERINIAERLYRITGAGIYADSVLLGERAPIAEPLLSAQVMGLDSVQAEIYRGRIFWIWGDTNQVAYLLGNFRATGARSDLPGRGGLDPGTGVNLRYFTAPSGFVKAMVPDTSVPGPGAVWLGGLAVVPDARGEERLFALYGRYGQNLMLLESGLLRWNDQTEVFDKVRAWAGREPVLPEGHTLRLRHQGQDYVYYHNPVRVPARAEALQDPAAYQAFTALQPGGTQVERDGSGVARYAWRTGVRPLVEKDLQSGLIRRDEALFGQVRDVATGQAIAIHDNSSKAWNAYRGRFAGILLQSFGASSFVGELWHAEGDTPMGPWVYAQKIVTHERYDFYNPRHHAFFDEDGGRRIYFEGTYTTFLSNPPVATPRYDYNQIMYRLDLTDPRLALPVPVYSIAGGDFVTRSGLRPEMPDAAAAFFAPDRPAPGTVPVYWSGPACRERVLQAGGTPVTPPLFYARPDPGHPDLVPLFVHQGPAGARAHGIGAGPPGWTSTVLAYVYRNPLRAVLPVSQYLPAVIADAGPDQCLTEDGPGLGVAVRLDGTRSIVPAGPVSHAWTIDGAPGALSGQTAEVRLGAGLHVVALTVTAGGTTSSDTVLVEVAAQDGGCACTVSRRGVGPGSAVLLLLLGCLVRVVRSGPRARSLHLHVMCPGRHVMCPGHHAFPALRPVRQGALRVGWPGGWAVRPGPRVMPRGRRCPIHITRRRP